VPEGDLQGRGSLDKRWAVVIVTVVVAMAAIAITAIITFGSHPAGLTSASTTTTHFVATSTTTISPIVSTTSTQSTTTSAPSTPARQTITYGSRNGMVVWQSGDPIPAGGNAYEGYYCCNEPFPDGMNRSGSAGCSGQGTAPNVVGGYYANGQLC
jgi:hypothetical protein